MQRRKFAFAAALAVAIFGLPQAAITPASAEATTAWEKVTTGWNRSSSPTIADIDGNGTNDIVIGHQDGVLKVLDADGNGLAGWPQQVGAAIDSSPTVGDIDMDGIAEIIVAYGSTWVPNQHGGVAIYNRNGSLRCRFTGRDYGNIWTEGGPDGYAEGIFSTPALGDIDGDLYPEIVFGGWDLHVHAMRRNCQEIPGFPYMVEDSTWSSPALYDGDGDGRLEIYIGSDQSAGGIIDWAGGEFRMLDWNGDAVHEKWRRRISDVFHSSPVVADVDADGRLEVVTGTGSFYGHPDSNRVWAFHLDDGSDVAGWPKTTGGVVWSSPAIADINADGKPDIIVGSRDGKVYAWSGTAGSPLLWSRLTHRNGVPGGVINSSPIIADIEANSSQEIIIGNDWGTFILKGIDGSDVQSPIGSWWSYESTAAIGNFGSEGWQVIIAGFDTPGNKSRLAAYSVSHSGGDPTWPMWRKSPSHIGANISGGNPLPPYICYAPSNPPKTPNAASARGYTFVGADASIYSYGEVGLGSPRDYGNYGPVAAITATPTGNGYWVLMVNGSIYSFGDAGYFGSTQQMSLNQPVTRLEPTVTGNGYWILALDGGVFSFGDAAFYGSTGGMALNAPVISISHTTSGNGYWLLALDGGVFSFGDAVFHGSTGAMTLNAPVISMAARPDGAGYWLLGADGGIFSFDVPYLGSVPGMGLCGTAVGVQLRPSATGGGYWVLAQDGRVFAYGDAMHRGEYPVPLSGPSRAVDLAIRV